MLAVMALAVAVSSCGGRSADQSGGKAQPASAAQASLDPIIAADKKPAKKLWVCPMHPEVMQDHPGVCPKCGMDLVEMEQGGAAHPGHSHGVQVDTATQQRFGVRLAAAKLQMLSRDIHAYGNVVPDESLIFNLSAKVEGVIKKLHVNSVGQHVRAGQVLFEIFSPELVKSQNEFIGLLLQKDRILEPMDADDAHTSNKSMPADDMIDLMMNTKSRVLVRDRLLYADVGNELIDELIRTYRSRDVVEIRAPQNAFITKIEVHEGSTVKPMDNLFSFASLSQVWVDVPLYPDQLVWIKEGDEAAVKLPQSGLPEIKARLQSIAPVVDSATRTARARLSVSNTGNSLPLGAFLDVVIHANPHKALAVPRSAVMRSGKGDMVMLADGNGHFTPVKVDTGVETDDYIEIIAGLQDGDQVVVNGQFLLDAAASMSDAAQRLHNTQDAGKH